VTSSLDREGPSTGEFVALIALTMSLVAMSIDAMLPALPAIASELGAAGPNDRQLVLTIFFAGMTVGQLVFGPLSDSIGRKRALYLGIALYAIGATICCAATGFSLLLAGRLLQGLGAAGPRIVALAVVRDRHAGREMARIMSSSWRSSSSCRSWRPGSASSSSWSAAGGRSSAGCWRWR
jgi:DHA1 family bicyclomycin/chloramphenicol resistance-like MFS transporter